MVTSEIGKIFLKAYNEKYGTTYNARTFFIEQFYPLFFDHNKYMLYVTNSPFVQGLPKFNDCITGKKEFEKPSKRLERLKDFLNKAENNDGDASVAVGFPSLSIEQATGSQITNLIRVTPKEDIYASWIGYALGIGVGGYTILFNDKRILIDVFEGWKYYRQTLNDTLMLSPNQINTWNGQWLTHYYDERCYDNDDPLSNFDPYVVGNDGSMKVNSQTWTKVLISIARKYEDKRIMGYVCSMGKTNTTIGFIPFDLTQIRRPIQLYEKLFGISDGRKAEALWGTSFGFDTACTMGVIGVKAMKPKGIDDYIKPQGEKSIKLPKKSKNEQKNININTYKIWLTVMLNNENLWIKTQEFAQLLKNNVIDKDKTISTNRTNLIKAIIESVSKKNFIDAVTKIIPFVEDKNGLKNIVMEVNDTPNDKIPYFLTLLRFQYQLL